MTELVACAAGRLNAVLWSWEADLDDGGGVASPLTNTPRAPKTHWRQAAQLLPRGVQLCEGEAVRIRMHTAGGRKLSFELEGECDEMHSGACTRIRPHASNHAPRTETPLPAEAAAATAAIAAAAAATAAAAAAAAAAAVQAVTLIGETVWPPAVAGARGGTWCASRTLVRARFASRRCRLPPPPLAPAAPDEHWLVAVRALDSALDQTAHDIAFSDEHVALYLHRDSHLQQVQPALRNKLLHSMRSQPGKWGDPAPLNVRCIELHHHAVGGGLVTPGHRDNGSKLTMSVMLSHPHELDGGEFVTYCEGMPVHHELARGDALLFDSERLHNVCPVTRGMRRSLVVELWARPENSSGRFR